MRLEGLVHVLFFQLDFMGQKKTFGTNTANLYKYQGRLLSSLRASNHTNIHIHTTPWNALQFHVHFYHHDARQRRFCSCCRPCCSFRCAVAHTHPIRIVSARMMTHSSTSVIERFVYFFNFFNFILYRHHHHSLNQSLDMLRT